jgi:tetratricopeptide (TPR) repeat protein
VVALTGFGDYFAQMEDGETKVVKPDGLSVNIVAVVQKVEGDRVWIKANGNGDVPVGWINKRDAVLLEDAVPYFTTRITREPKDWDSYLRRAEAEHALNRRDEAIADYMSAIEVNGQEPFLFLRRGREYRILKDCPHAANDFEQAARLKPGWAEAYDMAAGVYADCPDPSHRDQAKAIELINRAMALSPNPTYLTVLALAYFRSGDLEKAVTSQKQAVESSQFPPGYRDDALRQLHTYEKALAAEKH